LGPTTNLHKTLIMQMRVNSDVGIQVGRELTQYGHLLNAWQSGDQIQVGVRYSMPVQTGPGAHTASYTMGTGSFPGVKQLGRRTDHPPLPSAEVKNRVGLYIYSPFGPSWPILGWTLLGLRQRTFCIEKFKKY
jgi:hypothetical protein